MDLKGIIRDLGVMKFTLNHDMKLVEQRPYHLNLKYKENVHIEIEKMLTVGITGTVEESD